MLDHACCTASSHSTLIHLKSSTYIENNQKGNTYYLFPPPPMTHLAMPDLLVSVSLYVYMDWSYEIGR